MSAPNLEAIPDELKTLKRWVIWKYVQRPGAKKPTKPPYNAATDELAESNNPATWSTFEVALKALETGKYEGLGFMFGHEGSNDKTYTGIDLDNLNTPEKWVWANDIIKRFDSYTEISPSGAGVHILITGRKGEGRLRERTKDVEIYDKTHYFTITGDRVEGAPATVNEREEQLRSFYDKTFKKGVEITTPSPPVASSPILLSEKIETSPPMATDLIIENLRRAANGAKFKKLFEDGDISDYNSKSEADAGLAGIIYFRTQRAEQIKEIMLLSALKRLDEGGKKKWDRPDYLDGTIAGMLEKAKKEKWKIWTPGKKSSRKRKFGGNRSVAAVIADEILNQYEMVTVEKAKIILMKMENGGWKQVSKLKLGALTQQIGGRDKVTPAVREDVYGKILHENLIPDEAFEKRPDLFMDAEGKIFSSITLEIIKPDELEDGVFVIHQLGAAFDPSAPVPDEFLQGMELFLPGEDDRLALQEHMGSCLYRRMEYDKALTVLGDTRNGKSTMFKIFSLVIGDENISAITLQEMANPYKPYEMWGKLLNIQDDLPVEPIRNTSFFKTQTGGMPVTLMKKYGDPFKADVYCKNLFGCNLLPPAVNKSDKGYYSKFLCVAAPNTFTLDNEWSDEEREAGKLEPGHVKADPKLVDKLTSNPKKMSGILNWMLQGLARLEKQQGYSIKLSPEENRLRYDAMASPLGEIGTFIDMICEFARDYSKETRKADLYLLYNSYLQAKKVPGVTKNTFNDALVSAGLEPLKFRNPNAEPPVIDLEDSNAKRPYVIKGLVLKKNWKVIYEDWLELISISQNTAKIGA